jgi:hypothetical protein
MPSLEMLTIALTRLLFLFAHDVQHLRRTLRGTSG